MRSRFEAVRRIHSGCEDERTPIEERMGPITSGELVSLGIDSVERLREMGWEEAFLRWIEAYPERLNVNAAVGLAAASEGMSWLKLSQREKDRARTLVAALRRARRGSRGRIA
jgi:hypothetical protein